MNSIKNKILSVLLFTFAFFVVHDYVVVNDYSQVKYEVNHAEYEKCVDKKIHIHDSIHSIFSFNLQDKYLILTKLLDAKPTNKLFSLSSYVNLVPQRPPLA
nr:hypothetical protein [uncultured Sulfurimonas sp.]